MPKTDSTTERAPGGTSGADGSVSRLIAEWRMRAQVNAQLYQDSGDPVFGDRAGTLRDCAHALEIVTQNKQLTNSEANKEITGNRISCQTEG